MSNGNATEAAKPVCAVRHPIRDICPTLQEFGHPGDRLADGRWREVHPIPGKPAIDQGSVEPGPPSRKRAIMGQEVHGITERRRLRQTDLERPAKAAAGARACELHAHLASDAVREPRFAWQQGVAIEPGAFEGQKRAIERSWDRGIER